MALKKWLKSKLLKAVVLLGTSAVVGLCSQAQSTSFYTDRAVGTFPSSSGVQTLIPISYGQVRVCSFPLTQQSPCLPLANLTDINGNVISNSIGGNFGQLTTDVVGRFTFGCQVDQNYQLQVAPSSSNTPQLNYPITCPGTGPNPTFNTLNVLGQITAGNFFGGSITNPNTFGVSNFNSFTAAPAIFVTGTNSISTTGAVTVGSETNTGGLGSNASPQTVTGATFNTPAFSISRIDNSPPSATSNLLNGYLAPLARFTVTDTSGGMTGAATNLALDMNVKSKGYTTLTANITGSGVAQTIQVADSSVFTAPTKIAVIDFNKVGLQESVTITAIPDSTHITGVFTLNHTAGANLHQSDFPDYKSTLGVAMGDNPGSTADMNGLNPNITCNAQSPAFCIADEVDVTNNSGVRAATYYGEDSIHRDINALSILILGANNPAGSDGITMTSGDGVGQWHNAIVVEGSAQTNGVAITGASPGPPVNGFNVQAASTAGLIVGSNQTTATNPGITLVDPTDGIFLTAQGTGANPPSNTAAFQERRSSVNHIGRLQLNATQLRYTYDNVWNGIGLDSDGGISTQLMFRVRDGSNSTIGSFQNNGGAATFSINASGIYTRSGCTVAVGGFFRMCAGDTISWRNAGGSADITLAKSAADTITAPQWGTTTNCAAVGTAASPSVASCAAASAGHFSCATNATGATCQVNTTAVTANSEIFVFESDTAATGTALGVTCNTTTNVLPASRLLASSVAGASFTINLGTVTTNPACFSYYIVN